MIFQYYHKPNISITDIASKILGVDCSANPQPLKCDNPIWPSVVYTAYGFTCQQAGAALNLQSIQASIDNLLPVQPYFQWQDTVGSHTVLIVGYYSNDDLLIYDPDLGIGRQSYETVLYAYGRGSWQDTWYNIVPSGSTAETNVAHA
jgi:Papain-like cysteine protease AvrRpt2